MSVVVCVLAGKWRCLGDGQWKFVIDKGQMARAVSITENMSFGELMDVVEEVFNIDVKTQTINLSFWCPDVTNFCTQTRIPPVTIGCDSELQQFRNKLALNNGLNIFMSIHEETKVHAHELIFRPRLDSFTCNACGLSGDRSPYICLQCDFMIHRECLALPRVININRHDHRVSRTSFLGVVNSKCGVCQHKVDWIWGGYSCQRCPRYVVHSKCATREDVWNGKELEEIPEEIEDIEPYVEMDENTIKHFSHNEHYLKFHANGLLWEENKRCSGCNHPIGLQPFYGCIDCDFFLHKNCAESPKKKWHVFHNDRLTLFTSGEWFQCSACGRNSNGFMYECGGKMKLDVRCGAISEPFIHPGHPHHSLYYIPQVDFINCNGCKRSTREVFTCIESDCEFVLCFHCATLPQVVKHRVNGHPLSLCYGEQTSGEYWCEICEKETDPEKWFYTCKDRLASLHTKCVLGDFSGLRTGDLDDEYYVFEVVLNNSLSRPICWECDSRCMYPIILKYLETPNSYICSETCWYVFKG